MIKNGLCCIHIGLKDKGLSFKTMTWTNFNSKEITKSIEKLSTIYENNANVTLSIIKECAKNQWNYRVSSDIFPIITHPEARIDIDSFSNASKIYDLMSQCSEVAKKCSVRLSCHPDQFNVLASENENAVNNTIRELNYHGWFMSLLEPDANYLTPINIHLNCCKGNKEDIVKRLSENFLKLDANVRARLVFEVEDKGIWNARNLYDFIYQKLGIPITFDYLHHKCNDGGLTEEEAFSLCAKTWRNTKPLFHFCESLPDQNNPRKHADYPTQIPNTYDFDVDLDYEFKQKDLAIKKSETFSCNALNVV